MADIRHRVGIEASADATYQALSTIEGLAGWWTPEVQGDAAVGGRLTFAFGGQVGAVMEVTESVPGKRVAWHCAEGAADWVGTDLVFDLAEEDGETVLLFTHGGWREPVPFLHHCSTKWAVFLLGLKAGLEGGAATPYPAERAVSRWK